LAKHGPNRLHAYLEIHKTVMEQLRDEGFIGEDNLQVEPLGVGRYWSMDGQIACLGNIHITVRKTLKVVEPGSDPLVQTIEYAYNASVGGHNSFLRFDNAHANEYRHPGHEDEHHCHRLDWRVTDREVNLSHSPEWVGAEKWPTLGEFIRLVSDWYWENRNTLPEPDKMADQLRN
jgi:hypothetical protein